MIKSSFKHGNVDVPMQLGYAIAMGPINDRGLNILNMMNEGNVVIGTIMLDDATMLKVWWYYLEEAMKDSHIDTQTFQEALETLDENPKGLEPFRKAFWKMVVGFSPTSLQPNLEQMWKEAEKQLRTASITSTSASQPDSE